MQQQQRGQRKSATYTVWDEMSFLVCAILRWRLSAPGNARLTDSWRDVVCDWPNFHAPSMSVVNLDEVSLLHLGHHPKMFLFLLEEMAYAYACVGTDNADGLWVMAYKVLTMAERGYHPHKRSTNPQDTMQGDTMSHIVLGDLARLERLVWAIFDGVLATGASPELRPNESWERVVHGIFDKLVYIGGNPSNQWPAITMGVKDMQEPGVSADAPTTHSHHQGLEPTWSTNKGCLVPSVKSTVLAVPLEQVRYQRRWAAEAYSEWDEGEEDQAEFDYGRQGTFMLGGTGPPMVMCTLPNKSMKPNPWNVKLWFADMERQLQEEADYPWWPQVLPLTSGVGMAAEESAK